MQNYSFNLYLEINNLNYIFFVGKIDEENNFTIVYKLKVPLKGFDDNRISDSEEAFKVIKENIYLAEQKLGHTFNEIVIILENLNPTFLNSISEFFKMSLGASTSSFIFISLSIILLILLKAAAP